MTFVRIDQAADEARAVLVVASVMKVESIQIGKPREFGSADSSDPLDREWISGIFKDPAAGPVRLGAMGLEGDGQADLTVHGGVDKAVCVYPGEYHDRWTDELGIEFGPGGFGENFTTSGIFEADVCVGDVYRLGECLVQVTQPREPCWKLARRHRIKDLPARVLEHGRTGWYFRVLEGGMVEPGLELVLENRDDRGWNLVEANQVMHHRKKDRAAAAALAGCPGLSEIWRTGLERRAQKDSGQG